MTRLRSPEAEAGLRDGLTVEEVADRAILDCGGLEAAIGWCQGWAHRPDFRGVLDELTERARAA